MILDIVKAERAPHLTFVTSLGSSPNQPIKDLDFFVSFSSVASVSGNAGQTNYSAAYSVVDGFLDKLPNSSSIVIPAVSDLGYFARMSESSPALANFLSWSITSQRKHLSVSQ